MNLTLPKILAAKKAQSDTQLPARRTLKSLFSWLYIWDIYPILLIAGFLRLYKLNTSEFDTDQAAIFSMAREALHNGLLPIVSNRASIGIENPPAVIYLLMLPASLSADPLWATVMVGLLNTAAVLLTYFFTRRYYGRLAAVIAALLYAAAAKPLDYARFLWQQNMLAPLIVLFLFALYWGVVERRKGWFFPALLLLGIAYQLHETSALLVIPLLAAVVLAPGTVRWRDLAFALVSLLIIFSTYVLWEYSSHFADLNIVLNVAKLHAHIDSTAFNDYKFFISPYGFTYDHQLPSSPNAILRLFSPLLDVLRYTLLLLTLGGLAIATWLALRPRRKVSPPITDDKHDEVVTPQSIASPASQQRDDEHGEHTVAATSSRARGSAAFLRNWWQEYRASPYRCGLTLLVIWQVVPVLILSRHAVDLFPYYLLMLMPGPFMLMGIFVAQVVRWTQRPERLVGAEVGQMRRGDACVARVQFPRSTSPTPTDNAPAPLRDNNGMLMGVLRYTMYAVAAFAVIAQLITCTVTLIDMVQGNNGHGSTFNDLASLQHALGEADQLARQRHLNRVYITSDTSSQAAMRYLAGQMQTPTTLFDDARCLVLPSATDGPAVLLVSPYAQVTQALLAVFATTTLIDRPPRLGAAPFWLYIVAPGPSIGQPATAGTFSGNLQLVQLQRQQLNLVGSSWLLSRWNMLRQAQPGPRTTYNYVMTALTNGSNTHASRSFCTFTAMRAGDQLLVAFSLPADVSVPTQATIMGQAYTTIPYNPYFGPLHLETDQTRDSARVALHTTDGGDEITISLGIS